MFTRKLLWLFIVGFMSLLPLSRVSAADQILIARNLIINGSSPTLLPEMKHAQTFKIDINKYNVISQVDIAVNNLSPGKINLKVYPEGGAVAFGNLTVQNTATVPGISWFSFKPRSNFDIPQIGISSFVIVVTYDTNTETGWVSSDFANPYANGTAAQALGGGGSNLTYIEGSDHGFKIYGYQEAPPAPDQPAEENPVEPQVVASDSNSTSTDPSPSTSESSKTNPTVVASDTSNNASVKAIDPAITPPTLTSLKVNEEVQEADNSTVIEVSGKDVLEISGKAMAGSEIAIFVGSGYVFSAKADTEGNFLATISLSDIPAGTYLVSAQAQDSASGKGSELVDFFSLKLESDLGELVAAQQVEPRSFFAKLTTDYVTFVYLTGTLILLLLILLLLKIRKKRLSLQAS